jgi:immune inhibitor A
VADRREQFRGLTGPVARFGYDPGLLVWYRNRHFPVQGTGQGLVLVDAHPSADVYADGRPLRNTIQLRDAAFSIQPTTAVELYDPLAGSAPVAFPSPPAEPVFSFTQTSRRNWLENL